MSWSLINRFTSSSPREKLQATEWKYPFQATFFLHQELLLKTLIPAITAHKDEIFPSAQKFFFQTNEEFDQIIFSCFLSKRTKDLNDAELKGRVAYILRNNELVYINHDGERCVIDLNPEQINEIVALFPEKVNVLEPASKDRQNRLSLLTGHHPLFIVDKIGDLVLNLKPEELFSNIQTLMQDLLFPFEKSSNLDDLLTQKDPYLRNLIAGAFLTKIVHFLVKRLKASDKWNEQTRQQIDAIKTVCDFPTQIFFMVECEKRLEQQIRKQMSKVILADMDEQEKSTCLQKSIIENIFFRMLDPLSAHKIYLRELKKTKKIFKDAIADELVFTLPLDNDPAELVLEPEPQSLFFNLMHSALTEYNQPNPSKSTFQLQPRSYNSTAPIQIPHRTPQIPVIENDDPILLIPPKERRSSNQQRATSYRPKLELPTVSKVNTLPNLHSSGQAKGTLFDQDKPNSSRSAEEEFSLMEFAPTGM